MRETQEEAGLEPAMMTLYREVSTQINYIRKRRPKVVTYWLARLENPDQKVSATMMICLTMFGAIPLFSP